jgi:DNA-binding NarL/FixJ family response regulator
MGDHEEEVTRSIEDELSLTPRQAQIARMLAMGQTNGEICTLLGISPKTFDSHRQAMLKRLGVRNNVELARFAIKVGLVESP